jgi:hypothetical protein
MELTQFESLRDYNARNWGKAWQVVAGWLDPEEFDPETRLWCAECLGDHDTEFSRVVFASDDRIYGQTCDYCGATIWGRD